MLRTVVAMPVRWRWWSRSSRGGIKRRRRKSWSMAASLNMIRLRRSAPRKWVARCTRRCRHPRIRRWIGTPPSRETVRRWPTGEPAWPAKKPRSSTRTVPRRPSASMHRRRGDQGLRAVAGAWPAQGQGDRGTAPARWAHNMIGAMSLRGCGEGARFAACRPESAEKGAKPAPNGLRTLRGLAPTVPGTAPDQKPKIRRWMAFLNRHRELE